MIATFYSQSGPDAKPRVQGTVTLDRKGRAIWTKELDDLLTHADRLPDPAKGKDFIKALPERFQNAPYFWAEVTGR